MVRRGRLYQSTPLIVSQRVTAIQLAVLGKIALLRLTSMHRYGGRHENTTTIEP